jgi:hypothetical protein
MSYEMYHVHMTVNMFRLFTLLHDSKICHKVLAVRG